MLSTQPSKVNSGKKKAAIVAVLLIVVLLATGFVWAKKKVAIVADGRALSITTLHNNPQDILQEAGINLGARDEYRLSTAKVADDTTIEVYRSVPVTVICQGAADLVFTAKPTVGEFAESLGYKPETARTVPDWHTRIQPGMEVRIIRISEKIVEREAVEPFTIVRNPDPLLEKGLEEVVEEGKNGVKLVAVKQRFADGELASEETLSERITVAPKTEVLRSGIRETLETSRGTMRFKRVEYMQATAYLPTDGSGEGITATGIQARHGIVAVDPDYIPLGTRMYIPGYGLALAADTGGAIIGNSIDLCMESAVDAWRFGRRQIKVYILAD